MLYCIFIQGNTLHEVYEEPYGMMLPILDWITYKLAFLTSYLALLLSGFARMEHSSLNTETL